MGYPLLVSTQWLENNLADPRVEVIENAWIPDAYGKAHIAGAYPVPGHPYLKQFSAAGERTRHVMEPGTFADLCRTLGLRQEKHYVVYDDYYGLFAARFWAVGRYFGLHNISILDGGWRGWLSEGRAVSCRLEVPVCGSDLLVAAGAGQLIGRAELQGIYSDPEVQLWDTRRAGEYSGAETTENLRQGHIPGALNLVWTDLLQEAEYSGGPRFFKPPAEIAQLLADLGLRRDKTIVTYCQSGIRAAFGNFVLEMLGYPEHRLYDASMGEWANLPATPLEDGA